MKTAIIYARYSSDNQTEQSIEGQIHVCEEYAKTHDMVILDKYIDRAMTGTNDNRPDFQRMIKDSHKKAWDYVLVYKMDRFSRNTYATAVHKHTLEQNEIKLVSVMENIPDTPEGRILESLIIGMNQYYSEELSQKVRRGMKETRAKGNFTGGHLIYGYKVVDHKVVINEEEAEAIRFIYEQYSLDIYVKDIMKMLTEKGYYKNGKPFARNTVYNILKYKKYSGVYEHKGEKFTNIYPPIVDQEIFDKVRAKIDTNKYGKRSVNVVYLLRNKVKCGYCGSSINAETGTSKDGTVKRYYKCMNRKLNKGCKKSNIRQEFLEEAILKAVINDLSNSKTIDGIVDILLKVQNSIFKENLALNKLLREKRSVEEAIQNVMTAIEQGVITKTTTQRLKELEAKQEEIEVNISVEKNKTACKLSREEIKNYYVSALKLEPKMLISYIVKDIELFDDKIKIHYNMPLLKSPDDNQGFLLYSKIVKMSQVTQDGRKKYYIDFQLEAVV